MLKIPNRVYSKKRVFSNINASTLDVARRITSLLTRINGFTVTNGIGEITCSSAHQLIPGDQIDIAVNNSLQGIGSHVVLETITSTLFTIDCENVPDGNHYSVLTSIFARILFVSCVIIGNNTIVGTANTGDVSIGCYAGPTLFNLQFGAIIIPPGGSYSLDPVNGIYHDLYDFALSVATNNDGVVCLLD